VRRRRIGDALCAKQLKAPCLPSQKKFGENAAGTLYIVTGDPTSPVTLTIVACLPLRQPDCVWLGKVLAKLVKDYKH